MLSNLGVSQRAQLSQVLQIESVEDGTTIIEEGSDGDKFYVLTCGTVKCLKTIDGQQVLIVLCECL